MYPRDTYPIRLFMHLQAANTWISKLEEIATGRQAESELFNVHRLNFVANFLIF